MSSTAVEKAKISSGKEADPTQPTKEPEKKLKICCACPHTRAPRDECVLLKGEENCQDLIEAHLKCLRAEGFKV